MPKFMQDLSQKVHSNRTGAQILAFVVVGLIKCLADSALVSLIKFNLIIFS